MSFLLDVFMSLKDLVTAPFHYPLMLWEVGPLLFAILVVELYFGRYKEEKLGWNSSVSNSLILVFVGSNLLHFLYLKNFLDFSTLRSIIPVVLILIGFSLMFLDFFHILPRFMAFGVSSTLIVNVIAFVGVVLVHTGIPLTLVTFVAAVMLLILVATVFAVVHLFQDAADA